MSATLLGSESVDFRDGRHLCWHRANSDNWALLWNSFKLDQPGRGSYSLYNIESDPTESIDLIGTTHTVVDEELYGTTRFAAVERHMKLLLLACIAEGVDR